MTVDKHHHTKRDLDQLYVPDHRGKTPNSIFYVDSMGRVVELALGADNTVLTSTGATTAPAWETATVTGKGAQVRVVNDQVSIPESSETTITWEADEVVFDDASFFSGAAPTIFTVPDAGLYFVSASGMLDVAPATTWVHAKITIRALTVDVAVYQLSINTIAPGGFTSNFYLPCNGLVRLSASDNVSVKISQTDGGASVALDFWDGYFNIAKLGS